MIAPTSNGRDQAKQKKQRDSEIANEVVESPTKLGAGSPTGRAEGGH